MAYYRAYLLDDEGHITKHEIINAENDPEALKRAEELADGRGAEVWDLGRKVADVASRRMSRSK